MARDTLKKEKPHDYHREANPFRSRRQRNGRASTWMEVFDADQS